MQRKPPHGKPWIWNALWTGLIGLSIAYVFYASQGFSTAETTLSYSALIQAVHARNIASVEINGDQITGHLKKPSRAFRSVVPTTVGDPELLPLLERSGISIEAASVIAPWYVQLLGGIVPWILIVAVSVWIWSSVRGMQGTTGGATGFGSIHPSRYTSDAHPAVTFDDVAGADSAKAELAEEVDFLRNPLKYRKLGARIPKGILLVGPPGTGKTFLARAIAGEAHVPFLSLNASEFVEMFVGVGASRVRDLFARAKEVTPAIVFIDELDAVGRRRGAGIGTVNDEREQTLNRLLAELDGFDQRLDLIILAATNRPDVLDPALLRPGRFDRQVVVELPDLRGREAILKIHSHKLPLSADVNLHELAEATIGMSGADLENLCNEAALCAASHERPVVGRTDFEMAVDKLRMGIARPSLDDSHERRVVAYHEAGHAVAAWLSPHADPVHKVSIVPRGQALGHTEQLPVLERHNMESSYLLASLAVALAGRCAEELALNEVTTGAEQDLVEATTLARRMVTRWGMGGGSLAAFVSDEEQPFLGYEMARGREYSEATAARIDRETAQLLQEAYTRVRALLSSNVALLRALAERLMRQETVESEELTSLLGQRPASATGILQLKEG